MTSSNIFVPISSTALPAAIKERSDHQVPRLGIINQADPIQTNKFYANFFLGSRTCATWTHPYSVAWVNGLGVTGSWGLSVSHIERSQIGYGPGNPAKFIINPLGIQSIVLSARELGNSTSLTLDQLKAFSVDVNLAPAAGVTPMITFPLVQGMAFVTAVFNQGTPVLQSGVFFKTLSYVGTVSGSTVRYSVILNDGATWLIYMTPATNSTTPVLTLVNNGMLLGSHSFSGTVQVAKIPNGNAPIHTIYDASAGVYPLRGGISASVSGTTGTYTISWTKGGVISRTLLMFALPHHVQSLSYASKYQLRSNLQLDTTTKGVATAMNADSWILVENNLPIGMDFAPWSPTSGSQSTLPAAAIPLINNVATAELNEDMTAQTNLNSMYFAGKGLAKFAYLVYIASNLLKNPTSAAAGLARLKQNLARFINNVQIFPLVYDEAWGGVVSSSTYVTGNPGDDFGNAWYNDHHFHYGYFVYTAAVIAYLDPSWLAQGSNKSWVDMLVRDFANPSNADGYFPFSRMFDWWHGHSWAHGLGESADGKDQESSSEDGFASFAVKMWGRVTGDANMEARGNLMLAVQARSFNLYYLYQSGNTVEPARFIGNKVAGILFENKIHHTTFWSDNLTHIQGIHMLPLNPSTTLLRPAAFVTQEWAQYFANGVADSVEGGWRGVLYGNLGTVDPKRAWAWWSQGGFRSEWRDGGASRAGGLVGCAAGAF